MVWSHIPVPRRLWPVLGLGVVALLFGVGVHAADAAMVGPEFDTPLVTEQLVVTRTAPDFAAPAQAELPAGSVIEEISEQVGADGALWLELGQTDMTPLGWLRAGDLLPIVDLATPSIGSAPVVLVPQQVFPAEPAPVSSVVPVETLAPVVQVVTEPVQVVRTVVEPIVQHPFGWWHFHHVMP